MTRDVNFDDLNQLMFTIPVMELSEDIAETAGGKDRLRDLYCMFRSWSEQQRFTAIAWMNRRLMDNMMSTPDRLHLAVCGPCSFRHLVDHWVLATLTGDMRPDEFHELMEEMDGVELAMLLVGFNIRAMQMTNMIKEVSSRDH